MTRLLSSGGQAVMSIMPRASTVRSLCLLVISMGLLMLYVGVYVEQSRLPCTDHVVGSRDDHVASATRDVINVTSRRAPVSDESSSAADASWDYNWDSLAGETRDTSRIADRTLILVRHGQYDLTTGQLTPLGRDQAALTGERLRQTNITYSEITHSSLDRAVQTATIIHQSLPIVPLRADDMLIEGGPVPPIPTITYWHLPQKVYHVDGPRLEAAFRKYFYRPDVTLTGATHQILVAHGNIFRFFVLRALQLSKQAWMRLFIAHASITMLHIRADGTVSVTMLGDAGHFPLNKVTY